MNACRWIFAVCLAAFLGLPVAGAGAAEVAGVNVPESVKLGRADLLLNGAGIRTRVVFKVYVGALYVVERKKVAADLIGQRGPKRIALYMLRDLSTEQFGGALNDGLAANLTDGERQRFAGQIAELKATMEAVGNAKEKSVVAIDFLPEIGVRIAVDGAQRGKNMGGEDFYRALMKIWLGDKPADDSLKAAMLGLAP